MTVQKHLLTQADARAIADATRSVQQAATGVSGRSGLGPAPQAGKRSTYPGGPYTTLAVVTGGKDALTVEWSALRPPTLHNTTDGELFELPTPTTGTATVVWAGDRATTATAADPWLPESRVPPHVPYGTIGWLTCVGVTDAGTPAFVFTPIAIDTDFRFLARIGANTDLGGGAYRYDFTPAASWSAGTKPANSGATSSEWFDSLPSGSKDDTSGAINLAEPVDTSAITVPSGCEVTVEPIPAGRIVYMTAHRVVGGAGTTHTFDVTPIVQLGASA